MKNSTCSWPGCDAELVNGARRGRPRKWCDEHLRRRQRERSKDSPAKICSIDGCDRFVRAQDLCSTHYNREVFYRGERLTDDERRVRNGNPARRTEALRTKSLLRKSVTTAPDADPISRDAVGDRDGWVCGICDMPIDRSLEYPDDLSATVDHVVPIAHGGRHTWANTQISHFICNMRKGDSIAA